MGYSLKEDKKLSLKEETFEEEFSKEKRQSSMDEAKSSLDTLMRLSDTLTSVFDKLIRKT